MSKKVVLTQINLNKAAKLLKLSPKELGDNSYFMDEDGIIWWDDAAEQHGFTFTSQHGDQLDITDVTKREET